MQRWRDKVTAGTEREWADEREDKERDEYRKRVKEEEQREKKSHLKKRRVRKPPTCPSLDTHTHAHTPKHPSVWYPSPPASLRIVLPPLPPNILADFRAIKRRLRRPSGSVMGHNSCLPFHLTEQESKNFLLIVFDIFKTRCFQEAICSHAHILFLFS